MKCAECGIRESTGILVRMCDECFDAWEARVHSGDTTLTASDLAAIDVEKTRQAGRELGLVPIVLLADHVERKRGQS